MNVQDLFGEPGEKDYTEVLCKYFGLTEAEIKRVKEHLDQGAELEVCLRLVSPRSRTLFATATPTVIKLGIIDAKTIGTTEDIIAFEVE